MSARTMRCLRGFFRNSDGNVAMLFGIAAIPLVLGIGVAVDVGRGMLVRERMYSAADASALAIGSWAGLTQTEMKAKAQQFFDANYPPNSLGTVGLLDVTFPGDDIVVKVSGKIPTTFMRLANIDEMNIATSSTITKKERNIELALVLDTTGSMGGQTGKLTAMKSAAKSMVETLFDSKPTSDKLKIAVVPFAAAVNIGSGNVDSGWIDKNAASTVSTEDFTNKTTKVLGNSGLLKKINRSWGGCVRERGGAYELTDDAPSGGTTLFAPYFAPDEPSTGTNKPDVYDNSYLKDGTSPAVCNGSTWGGGGWGSGGGTTTANNSACQKDTTKYTNPQWEVNSSSDKGPEHNCPPRAITPLTNTKSTVTTAIDQLADKGNTVIPAGLLWGWRVVSPGEPFSQGKSYTDEKVVKAIVLLTDGENNVSGSDNYHNKSTYNAFGFASSGHLGNTNGNSAETTLNSKLTTVCNAVKAKNILVYTIGFQITDTTTQNLLKNCASKTNMYYNSPNNSQLAGIFQDIAQGLGELRIAR
jgi:Flp pilus assembly protein TadG